MTKTLLDLAKEIIDGDRQEDYGDKQDNFERIAGMWSAYIGKTITPRDVCALYILGKLARIAHNEEHLDSWLDMGGYTEIGATILTGDDEKTLMDKYREGLL